MTRSKLIAAYEAACPNDPIADDDPRRDAIMGEMRQIRSAESLAEAAKVIAWWSLPANETLRIAAKIRGALGADDLDPYWSLEGVIAVIESGRANHACVETLRRVQEWVVAHGGKML